jgi:hypothetical protein
MQVTNRFDPVKLSSAATLLAAALAAPVAAQITTRVSVDSAGAQGNSDSGGDRLAISADGRYVAFCSAATNLVTGDTNGAFDVFVRDLQNGTTERVNVDSTGAQTITFISHFPAISADGRYVAFQSASTNLVAGDTNANWDVFVRDRVGGTTERVSVSSAGAQAIGTSGDHGVSMSADGRYVAFVSGANNLVAGDTNGSWDTFVRDRQLGLTTRVSVDSTGVQGNGTTDYAAISATGRYVAFASAATNLVAGDTNGVYDIFLHDRVAGTTERVSVDSAGVQGNGVSSWVPACSSDGRYVLFRSYATNLVPGDTNASGDLFVRDRQTATTERVSVDSAGVQGNGDSGDHYQWMSPDGRYVVFQSGASNLVPGDTNGKYDVFVRDRQAGTTERVSVDSAGAQATGGHSSYASISADGHYVAFASDASNLVTGDTNFKTDVFVHARGGSFPGPYCTAGTTTNGCLASISAVGVASASSGSGYTLTVTSVEGQKQGLVFYGVNNSGFTPSPWGAGSSYLCVKSPTQRTGVLDSGGTGGACDGAFALDFNAFITANPSSLGSPFAAGQHVFAQGWFRDPPSPKTTSLSNALEFVVGP